MAYDGTWSEHISKENDAIKLTLKDIEIKIYHVYSRGKELELSMFISPINPSLHSFSDRDSQVQYDVELFKIKDNVSGKYYVPVNHRFFKRGSKNIYHQMSLEYLLDTDSISDFQLILEKGALKLNSKNIKTSPVNYKKKEVNTVGYFEINS